MEIVKLRGHKTTNVLHQELQSRFQKPTSAPKAHACFFHTAIMSSHYNTEPPPTASATLHTSAGPLTISLFAKQTPLACRNFLQCILDGYYNNTPFHRVVPGFIIQGGDPTGTGEGGRSIYEDKDFENDAEGEKIIFKDEIHSRLRFNRRGLVGMARTQDGNDGYGSQFFITLSNCEAELNGKCTLFGRIEGDSIYNVVKVAEGELVKGTERPLYPVKVTGAEVGEMPKGGFWETMQARERPVTTTVGEENRKVKKRKKVTAGKTLLSFGGDDGDTGMEDAPAIAAKKPKFNTNLVSGVDAAVSITKPTTNRTTLQESTLPHPMATGEEEQHHQRASSHTLFPSSPSRIGRPSFHDPSSQFPIPDPEQTSRYSSISPEPSSKPSVLSRTNAEIASLKASMRRTVDVVPENSKKKSALEQMIPRTSVRGRKRRGLNDHSGGLNGNANDSDSLKLLNAFRAKLDQADDPMRDAAASGKVNGASRHTEAPAVADDDEEARLCDLHFIANCQSCRDWDTEGINNGDQEENDNDRDWMTHALSFEKDRLGKDLTWRRKNEEELVVIDPREKGKEIKEEGRRRKKEKA